jgi:hypothetical protein
MKYSSYSIIMQIIGSYVKINQVLISAIENNLNPSSGEIQAIFAGIMLGRLESDQRKVHWV